MLKGKKIVVVMPAFNAERTLAQVYGEIPFNIVDEVILTDDFSKDNTFALAEGLGIKHVLRHDRNMGYGANQKTCYKKAKELGADIVLMIHPDYQYTPRLIEAMASIIANEVYPVVLGSRILGKGALKGGMPLYKYIANRGLTFIQNLLMSQKLS
ncbi:MAG: glycosyltransferase involved in cell wall biosynthesis, partial [Nonlabens sp.]